MIEEEIINNPTHSQINWPLSHLIYRGQQLYSFKFGARQIPFQYFFFPNKHHPENQTLILMGTSSVV